MHRRTMAIVFLFALISLGFSSPVLVRFFGTDGRLVDSREFPDGAVAIPSEWTDGVVRIYSLPDTTLLATISVDPEHCGYADQSGWASVAATAMRTLGTTWADSCDSANWADQSGHSLVSDSAQFAVFADSAGTATFADSARISAFADSTRTSAYADSAGAAALAYNLVPGDGDYIQNQTSASQPASFWISGAGWIGDSLRVDGNVNIGGELTVAGGIDPIYLALTPQVVAPGVDFALWVNAADSALVYFDGTSSVHLITATDTVLISFFADSARVAAYADSAVYSDTALYVAGSSVVGRVDSARFADTVLAKIDSALYSDTALYVAGSNVAGKVDSALYSDTTDYARISHLADSSSFATYSDTADFSVGAHLSDSATNAIYSDTADFAFWSDSAGVADTALNVLGANVVGKVDSAIYSDTAFFAARAETSVYSDTALYIAGTSVVGKVDSAQFADTVLGKIDSAQFADTVLGKIDSSLYSDTSAVAGDLLPGDADYIQNLTPDGVGATGQSADFDITGDAEIGGDLYIFGKLTVDGGIDPTYLALTPQSGDPDAARGAKLWVDNSLSPRLIYNSTAGTNLIVIATPNGKVGDGYIDWGTGAGQVDAADVPYSPAVLSNWGGVDPQYVNAALDTLAARVNSIGSGGLHDLTDGRGIRTFVYNGGAAETVEVDLFAGGGLEFAGSDSALAVEVGDFAGNGLAGSDRNLYVDVADSGALTNTGGTGSQLAVLVDGITIGINGSNQLYIPNGAVDENLLSTSVAGQGLVGGGGNPLDVNVGAGLTISNDTIQIDENGIPYTPSTPADWSGGADPGNVDDALDQLASRVSSVEDTFIYSRTPDGIGATGQTADFDITGDAEIGGDLYIFGKLTVDGGIDPTYMAFAPQTSDPAPGTTSKLWVDAGGNLQYSTSSGNEAVVTSGNIGTYGVTSINTMTGAITFRAGTGLSITATGDTVTYSLFASLDDLIDVSTAGATNGQVLKWNAAYAQWVPANESVNDSDHVVGNEYNIDLDFDDITNTLSLTDSGGTLTTTINNEADDLSDNSIDDLNDVSTGGAVNGQVLTWNGSAWVPQSQAVQHDGTLTGDGTSANPLGVANNSITSSHIQDGTITTDDIQNGTITGSDINSSTDVTVENLTANTRVSANVAVNLPIYSGANSTPSGLSFTPQDGDMIIWDDTSSGHDYKICVYVGGTWQCTDVN